MKALLAFDILQRHDGKARPHRDYLFSDTRWISGGYYGIMCRRKTER